MQHSNILCVECGTHFTYESQRTVPRAFCTSLCRGRNLRANNPEYYNEAARKSYHKHKKPAEAVEVTAECVHCRESFTSTRKGKRAQTYCSPACIKAAHYVANKADYIARAKAQNESAEYLKKRSEHYYANKAHYQAKGAKWRAANKGVLRERRKKYYEANREARQAYYREWVALPGNRERICNNAQQWAQMNPEKVRTHKAIRRHLMRERILERFDPMEIFERDGWICQLCNEAVDATVVWPDRMSKSLDHIIPISKGGVHSRANTQLAHLSCNASKNDRMPELTTQTRSAA